MHGRNHTKSSLLAAMRSTNPSKWVAETHVHEGPKGVVHARRHDGPCG